MERQREKIVENANVEREITTLSNVMNGKRLAFIAENLNKNL